MNEHVPHRWVVVGNFEIQLDQSEVRRIINSPSDAALSWRQRATLVEAHGPGCERCGAHAKDAIGTSCPGEPG